MAAVTYPGTVTPLRGLAPFTEAERDVLFGRDRDRDDLTRMVTADGFRAGLLHGEHGVGKTSLLRAGLLPHLRDHGVVVVPCDDLHHPAQSLAGNMATALGGAMPQHTGEPPLTYLARALAGALPGKLYLFVIDDVDVALGRADDRVIGELGELFARVVSRSGGRARFLFACASERVHRFGVLERRTGSLFPPSSRHELARLSIADAALVLDRTLALAGVTVDPALADAVARGLGRGRDVLPADIQIAAIAMRELGITTTTALTKLGGATELERAWLTAAAQATGDERAGLRVIAELADDGAGPLTADQVARDLALDPTYTQKAFEMFCERGVIERVDIHTVRDDDRTDVTARASMDSGASDSWVLRHEILAPRLRELTAPARASARRAYDLLGSKTASRQRLGLAELRALRAEGIAPATPAEKAVIDRSRRFYYAIAGAIAATPLILLIIIYVSMSGRYYLDVAARPGGERVVVRAGRAGLSSFHWMPASPGFGDVVADTGLSRAMVEPGAWSRVRSHDIGGEIDGWAAGVPGLMTPRLAGLIEYAASGDEAALEGLRKQTKGPDDLAELLTALRPIARGGRVEVALVETALADPSPAVQQAAVAVAGAAARRHPDAYTETLIDALRASDPELRRTAFAAVRALGGRARSLFEAALTKDPDATARRELLVEVSTAADDTPSPSSAVSVLADGNASAQLRDRARSQLRRAFSVDAAAATQALVKLLGDDQVPPEARVLAAQLALELVPDDQGAALADAARVAFGSKAETVRIAALPLYARVSPQQAAGDLALILDDKKASRGVRVAMALAWGELARSQRDAAQVALERLIKDDVQEVRAAAASAYGYLGRVAQEPLIKMVKNERYEVSIGAAEGLAASAEVGASAGVAVDGIAQLWKQKGRPRRDAARIYAKLARKKPAAVMNFLAAAARSPEDPALHPIGVEGLCNAANAGSAEARRNLTKVTDDPALEVRRLVMRCVADGPEPAKNGPAVASRLIKDADAGIRAEAARILAMGAAKGGKVAPGVGEALVTLVEDADRDVRLIAVRAVASLGTAAPKNTAAAFTRAFERADEAEKMALLRAARQVGAGDLVAIAITDDSAQVRVEAVDTALATGERAAAILGTALSDADPQVRRIALTRLASEEKKLDRAAIDHALALAARDPDPDISQLALTTLARIADKDIVIERLGRALASRIERVRAQAAAAAVGLVDRDAALATQLLTPLLEDPSHDVRVAMLASLAAAHAKTNSPDQLSTMLRGSEHDAMARLVATAAFVILARTDAGRAAAEAALGKLAKSGPSMARRHATIAIGLIGSGADGLAFLELLVP